MLGPRCMMGTEPSLRTFQFRALLVHAVPHYLQLCFGWWKAVEVIGVVKGSAAIRFSAACEGYNCPGEADSDNGKSTESQKRVIDGEKRSAIVHVARSV